MKMSLRFLPIILFFVFYGLIQLSFHSLAKMEKREDKKDTRAILEIVSDRFKRYLELPHMVGALGSKFLAPDIQKAEYEGYARIIEKSNPEFLGFNILNDKGLIIRIYPEQENVKAQGKVSQMLSSLKESLKKGEPFYFSPPFRLFQGQQGFVFYFPIMKNTTHLGWYAVVISSESFLEKFALEDFLSLFNLVIIDEATGLDYFATSMMPANGSTPVFSKTISLYGRSLTFKTWRKVESPIQNFPWYFSVIISLILAGGSAIILRLLEQRRRSRNQLENISVLLRVTSKEALSNLIEIHSEINQLNLPEDEKFERLSRDITYLTNLIEQIDLLQTMAHSREGLSEEQKPLLKLMESQLDNFSDVFQRKNIRILYDELSLGGVKLRVNEWLFENSVLSNVISHLLIHIESDSEFRIEAQKKNGMQMISFRIKRHPTSDHTTKILTRRIEVAKKVLELQGGYLREEFLPPDELIITISLADQ